MRSEREMLDMMFDTARADEQVRAVLLSGARTNPAVARAIFHDFDVVSVVRDVAAFTRDHS